MSGKKANRQITVREFEKMGDDACYPGIIAKYGVRVSKYSIKRPNFVKSYDASTKKVTYKDEYMKTNKDGRRVANKSLMSKELEIYREQKALRVKQRNGGFPIQK